MRTNRLRPFGVVSIGWLVFCGLLLLLSCRGTGDFTVVPFETVVVDAGMAGDVKLAADIDGDGFTDLIVAGKPGEDLNWYRFPHWRKRRIAVPAVEFTTDGEIGDVDGDGDPDIVLPDGPDGVNLLWFENPLPSGDPLSGADWERHEVGAIGNWGKDVELADFDGDSLLDVATRGPDSVAIFFQAAGGSWSKRVFSSLGDIGSEGMGSGDIDRDGAVDLVLRGFWLRNPAGARARVPGEWSSFRIGPASRDFKALVTDINGDGVSDVVFSSSEETADVRWWTPATGDPTGDWKFETVASSVNRAHTLQAADMDMDGDLDLVVGQLHISPKKELAIYYNENGAGTAWVRQVVDRAGLHNGVVADIGNDGDFDIFGANFTGNPPLRLWINRSNPRLDRWRYIHVDGARERYSDGIAYFGLAAGDLDGDGLKDIVSGKYFYRNPGGILEERWQRVEFPVNADAMLIVDVDGDVFGDVIAQALPAVYWLEAVDSKGNSWVSRKIGEIPATTHRNGQGYVLAQIVAGGRPEILLTGGTTDNEIYYFEIPDDPEAGGWPKTRISDKSTDEGVGTGDIDGDGDIDIASGLTGGKSVAWFENPGDGSPDWTAHHIGGFDGVFADRVYVADINGDKKPDVLLSEENGGNVPDTTVCWYEQPDDPRSGDWTSHRIASAPQYTTNGMDVADMDGDGDMDVITGEHRNTRVVAVWENIDKGSSWLRHVVSKGRESHLGARVADLDNDGDLDIMSIGWDDYQDLHLWRNEAAISGSSAGR